MSVQWQGLDSFKQQLRNLPEHLTDLASTIVVTHAQDAERSVQAGYPEGPTGNLRRGVRSVIDNHSKSGVSVRVRSTARHAHLVDRDKPSAVRKNRKGANRGRMPALPDSQRLIPIAIRARRRMYAALAHMLQTEGFTVTQS